MHFPFEKTVKATYKYGSNIVSLHTLYTICKFVVCGLRIVENTPWNLDEINQLLKDSEPRIILTSVSELEKVLQAADGIPSIKVSSLVLITSHIIKARENLFIIII